MSVLDKSYTDGLFDVGVIHGYNFIQNPLIKLPEEFSGLQSILDRMSIVTPNGPGYLAIPDRIAEAVQELPDYSEQIELITDVWVIHALYRGYTFLASAYLLEPAHQTYVQTGSYGVARNRLPRSIAGPLCLVSNRLGVHPWLDYHYSYSLGNYVLKDPNGDRNWENLDMACKFTGGSDEVGFIMVHVDLNRYTNILLKGILGTLRNIRDNQSPKVSLQQVLEAIIIINERRREMWKASDHKRYNDFRVFIMGIQGNTEIFPDGVVYEGQFDDKPQYFRGQSGSQDDIIPTLDIFTGVNTHYPNNKLTEYLLDMRQYRPRVVREFFEDLETASQGLLDKISTSTDSEESLRLLYRIVEQIYMFRNGHWMFVQKYIMANTRYNIATGGTPITTWIPNQIEACLVYMEQIISKIVDAEQLRLDHKKYVSVLTNQIQELQKVDFDANLIYYFNQDLKETEA